MITDNRCPRCGCPDGHHQKGCKNRQGNEGYTYRSGADRSDRTMRDLLEAAEEMYEYCDNWRWKYGPEWKAAIDAARKEIGE